MDNVLNWWQQLLAFIGVIGGLDFIKWFFTRKQTKRITKTQADSDEFHILRETIEFLQEQLKNKEVRFAEQTELVRKLNSEVLEKTTEISELKIKLSTLRCDDETCPFRQPPTATTPPLTGLTKEAFFAPRLQASKAKKTKQAKSKTKKTDSNE